MKQAASYKTSTSTFELDFSTSFRQVECHVIKILLLQAIYLRSQSRVDKTQKRIKNTLTKQV
jgi:hypothetical protein